MYGVVLATMWVLCHTFGCIAPRMVIIQIDHHSLSRAITTLLGAVDNNRVNGTTLDPLLVLDISPWSVQLELHITSLI